MSFEKRWKELLYICHNFYFTWRNTVVEQLGQKETIDIVLKFWEKIGKDTANAYLKRGRVDVDKPVTIAKAIKRSCEIMGEVVELVKRNENDVVVRHIYCPWWPSHKRLKLERECQLICDKWFQCVVKTLNSQMKIVTLKSIPRGNSCCERCIWL